MKKKIILTLVILILLAVGILCVINAYKLVKLDYNLQLENNGFVKDDITMLSHEQVMLRGIYISISCISFLGIVVIIMYWIFNKIL